MTEYRRPKSKKDLKQNFKQIKPLMDATMAHYESSRCLFCFDAPCIKACPTGIDIPLFIRQIQNGNTAGAAATIYDANYFGNACGKVCPTEVLCEGACVYNHQDSKPIEIGRLQSYATTHAIKKGISISNPNPSNGKRIAVIGAGPAGISCACELQMLGYNVDIYESKNLPAGLTLYGVAPYKITNREVLEEMRYLQKQFGFKVMYNKRIRKAKQFRKLEQSYDAIFLGIGLGPTAPIAIEGEKLKNSIGAVEFIEKVKTNPAKVKLGDRVVVIGGGNTAMDAASEAARLGAKEVILVYRRSKEQMRAYGFEYDLAKGAGVQALFNHAPLRIEGKKRVKGIVLIKTDSSSGKVKKIRGSKTTLKADMVIRATGQEKFRFLKKEIEDFKLNKNGTIKIDPQTYQTTHPKYFAGGDAVNGGKEVVNAVAEGKVAAHGIDVALNS